MTFSPLFTLIIIAGALVSFTAYKRIFKKAGYESFISFIMAIGMVFPPTAFIILIIFAFGEWPMQKKSRFNIHMPEETPKEGHEEHSRFREIKEDNEDKETGNDEDDIYAEPENQKTHNKEEGRQIPKNLANIILLTALIITGIAYSGKIKKLFLPKIAFNEETAKEKVKLISDAVTRYKKDNYGTYPMGEFSLMSSKPVYLKESYNNKAVYGYGYYIDFRPDGCTIIAEPLQCRDTGNKIFKMEAGGVMQEELCDR